MRGTKFNRPTKEQMEAQLIRMWENHPDVKVVLPFNRKGHNYTQGVICSFCLQEDHKESQCEFFQAMMRERQEAIQKVKSYKARAQEELAKERKSKLEAEQAKNASASKDNPTHKDKDAK